MKPKLSEVMPASLGQDKKFVALAKALDLQLEKLSGEVKQTLFIPRLDELSGKVLDLLAWQLHVDNYTPIGLSDETKRNLIRNSIAHHKRKGTRAAVEEVCAAFGNKVDLEEWFETSDLEPYWFRLTAQLSEVGNNLDDFVKRIWSAKNVRSHLILRLKKLVNFKAYTGIGEHRYGKISINRWDKVTISPNKTIDELNGRKFIIEPGKVTVVRDGEETIITPDFPSDYLQLKLAFPSGSRTITFKNPRQDLTAADIQDVADYAIDNDLLLRSNDTADDLTSAKLITIITQDLDLTPYQGG